MAPNDDQISRYLADPLSFPPEFKNWVVKYLEQHQPSLLIRQLAGTLLPSKIAGYPGSAGKVLAGDGTWPGGMVTVYDAILPGSAGVIDTGAVLPTTYAVMQIDCYLRSDTAANATSLNLRFNNDSAGNYDYQRAWAINAAPGAAETYTGTFINAGTIPAGTAGANLFGVVTIVIPHYAGTSNNKACHSHGYMKSGTTANSQQYEDDGGSWRSNTAINRVVLAPGGGNFVADSRVTISVRSA